MYACLYFASDKSVSVLPKSRCKLRGPFEPKGEVEVDWSYEGGQKQRHIASVLKIIGKGKLQYLNYYVKSIASRAELYAHVPAEL